MWVCGRELLLKGGSKMGRKEMGSRYQVGNSCKYVDDGGIWKMN